MLLLDYCAAPLHFRISFILLHLDRSHNFLHTKTAAFFSWKQAHCCTYLSFIFCETFLLSFYCCAVILWIFYATEWTIYDSLFLLFIPSFSFHRIFFFVEFGNVVVGFLFAHKMKFLHDLSFSRKYLMACSATEEKLLNNSNRNVNLFMAFFNIISVIKHIILFISKRYALLCIFINYVTELLFVVVELEHIRSGNIHFKKWCRRVKSGRERWK